MSGIVIKVTDWFVGFEFGILAAAIFLIFKSEVTIFGKEVDLKE